MNRTLAALPVDGRPAVRSQVQDLVACAGWTLRVPEVAALGHLRRPAPRDELRAWLLQQASEADGFVLSLDMLVYGGLVPSRFIEDDLPSLLQRLEVVRELRKAAPGKPIYAFAATMRISNNDVAEEEKAYWSEHGRRLWAWSYHVDRARQLGAADSAALAQQAEAAVPAAVREDYLATRQRNLAVTRQALQMVKLGLIDRLVLPQDDTAEFGLNIAERRDLQVQVAGLGLGERVAVYPGADEVMHTLCARMVSALEQRPALRVALAPSEPAHIGRLRALYEDRPVLESVASQVQAVGALLTRERGDADLLLALHTQGTAQGDWAMRVALPQRVAVDAQWLAGLHDWHAGGRPLALADLACANGGDPWLLEQPLPPLSAYAGWNTASNSLGSVLSTSVLAWGRESEPMARRALALRLLEDQLYQAHWRQVLRDAVNEADLSAQDLLARARQIVIPPLNAWAAARRLGWRVADLRLPWGRSFEVELLLEPEP